MEAGAQEFHVAVVDGVRVVWSRVPGPVSAGLICGFGQADEPLAGRGLAHLVEHVTLDAPDLRHDQRNGQVDLRETIFHVRGDERDAARFVSVVAGRLARPETPDLDHHVRILRTEASQRGASQLGRDLYLRYGHRGPGTVAAREFGLEHATEDAFRARAADLVRSGVVAWATAPPGDGWDLAPLTTAAPPVARPPAAPLPQAMPACDTGAGNLCSVSFLLPRSPTTRLAGMLLAATARDLLRAEHGLSYTVAEAWEPVGPERALLMVTADCLAEHALATRDALLAAVDRFVERGADPSVHAAVVELYLRQFDDPAAAVGSLVAAALDLLHDTPTVGAGAARAEVLARSPSDFGRAIGAAADTQLVLTPPSVALDTDRRFTPVAWHSGWTPTGRTLTRREAPTSLQEGDTLVVAPDAVAFVPAADPFAPIVVTDAGCEALLRYPDGARSLLGADGFSVSLHPDDWDGGRAAVAELDARIDASCHVTMAEPSRTAPPRRFSRAAPTEAPPAPAARRRWYRIDPNTPRGSRVVGVIVAAALGLTWIAGSALRDDATPVPPTTAPLPSLSFPLPTFVPPTTGAPPACAAGQTVTTGPCTPGSTP